ncbi:unnamed protein product [Auanema sp. JU1783]|nr:unnamed protein product [Auanema sp. JU1783]
MNIYSLVAIVLINSILIRADHKKKDLSSYTDADLEKLFDEWEENDDEKLDEDELPSHKQKPKEVDLDALKAKAKSPEDLVRLSKKGQPLMMFVSVTDPEHPKSKNIRPFTEHWSGLWQSALYNNHIESQVFTVDDDRVIFMFKDGAQAFEGKDYLLKQPHVREITLEGKQHAGPASQADKTEL